jgi:hypothetical protein
MSVTRKPLSAATLLFSTTFFITLASAGFAQTETVLYSFQGTPDGLQPSSALVEDSQGNLYGTTPNGGAGSGFGTAFQLTPPSTTGGSWTETVIYSFGSTTTDGTFPLAGLIFDKQGNLYGTTFYGGTGNCSLGGPVIACGTVFKLSPPASPGGTWTESILYSFQGGTADGRFPAASLIFDEQGNLYGTTTSGGNGFCYGFPGLCGIAFKLSPPTTPGGAWTERIIHNFGNGSDGQNPAAALLLDKSGVLFGTTEFGGQNNCDPDIGALFCGTIFQLSPPVEPSKHWSERFISLGPGIAQGFFSPAGLVQGPNGNFYGVTTNGGPGQCIDELGFPFGCGVVFEVTPPALNHGHWRFRTLYEFTGMGDGAIPLSTLITDNAGNLYGAAAGGGGLGTCTRVRLAPVNITVNGCGTIFQLSPPNTKGGSWTETTLHQFSSGSDGAQPSGSIIPNRKGGFFGTTREGGGSACNGFGCGVVFEISR